MKNILPLNRSIIFALALSVLSLLAFTNSFAVLFHRWAEDGSYYSHIPFVLFVFAFLLKKSINKHAKILSQQNFILGTLIITSSLVLNIWSKWIQVNFLQSFALYLFIIGNSILFLGQKFVRKNIGIYLYLLFMAIPVPSLFITRATFELKLLSSHLSELILSYIYPSTTRFGNMLNIEGINIEVTTACSGLKNILAMLSLIWPLAILQKKTVIAWIDYLLAIPAAILANIIRIVVVCVLTVEGYGQVALIDWHEEIGLAVFFLVFLLIAFFNEINFSKFKSVNKAQISFQNLKVQLTLYLIILLLLAPATWLISSDYSISENPLDAGYVKDKIPKNIGQWTSQDEILEEDYFRILKTKDLLMRAYTKGTSEHAKKTVYFYLIHAKETQKVSHPPELCYEGDGFKLQESSQINLEAQNMSVPANRMIFRRGDRGYIVYYLYQIGDRYTANLLDHQILSLLQISQNNGSSLIRLSVPFTEDPAQEENWLKEFVFEAMPQIFKSIN